MFHLAKDVYKKQSFRGFYKGWGASVVTQPSFWLIYMPVYEHLKKEYPDAPKFVTSNIAGSAGALFTNPLWVMRARMQTEVLRGDRVRYTTFFQKTIREEGVTSLWKGGAVALFKNLQMGIQLPLYEYLRDEKSLNPFWSGIFSKMFSSTVMYPLDVIRTNLRAEVGYVSFKDITKKIYNRNGGFLNFYRGIPLYYFSQLPTFAVTMVVFEKLKKT
jgi:solute carrier family 25 folate transporter 32